VTEKFIPFGVWAAEPELEAELKGGGDRLLVPELGRGVVNRNANDPEDRALLVSPFACFPLMHESFFQGTLSLAPLCPVSGDLIAANEGVEPCWL